MIEDYAPRKFPRNPESGPTNFAERTNPQSHQKNSTNHVELDIQLAARQPNRTLK
jgi:hypothetical protein